MDKINMVLDTSKAAMLLDYPEQQELTVLLFGEISGMMQEDFYAISQRSKRLKLVFDCIRGVLTKMQSENVKKKYATNVLDALLDIHIVRYMENVLQDTTGEYKGILKSARAELSTSQWSDPTSKHWQRAISKFQ